MAGNEQAMGILKKFKYSHGALGQIINKATVKGDRQCHLAARVKAQPR